MECLAACCCGRTGSDANHQMLTNGCYGYFRDELYFLAANDHLAFGDVDFAPLIALLTHLSRVLLGVSRLIPHNRHLFLRPFPLRC